MKLPLVRLVFMATFAAVLSGCATTGGSKFASFFNGSDSYVNNRPDQLQKLQEQTYEAATGPYHVGSTYKP